MQLTVAGFAWPLMAVTLPVAATATYLILRTFWSEIGSDRDGHREAEAVHRAIAIRLVLFVMALDVLVMLNLGGVEWIRAQGPRLVVVLFGSVFIVIGNLLPRTRPNLALGIRTSRTLSDRPFWFGSIARAGIYPSCLELSSWWRACRSAALRSAMPLARQHSALLRLCS
jgi:uncharacterized membrane protein